MKKKIILICLFILFILWITISSIKNNDENDGDYTRSIYVITENAHGNGTKYYEINDLGKIREIANFQSDKYEKYCLNNCFESYVDRDSGKVLNYLKDTCEISDEKGNNVSLNNNILMEITSNIANLEHSIIGANIYKINERYYAVVNFNVNLWDPYKLYYYDEDIKKLKLIYAFNGEEVIGIKENTYFNDKEVVK